MAFLLRYRFCILVIFCLEVLINSAVLAENTCGELAYPLCAECYSCVEGYWTLNDGQGCCHGIRCYNTGTHHCCSNGPGSICPIGETCCDVNHMACYHELTEVCCEDRRGSKCPRSTVNPYAEVCCKGTESTTCLDPNEKCCNDYGKPSKCPEHKDCCYKADGTATCCEPNECETCVDGECKVCGGDPSKKCCDGQCCDKIWTKGPVYGSTVPCPECQVSPSGLCNGTTQETQTYEVCKVAATGQGEHCQCYMTDEKQIIGHIYPCKINVDCSHVLYCAGHTLTCIIVCGGGVACPTVGEELICLACLMNNSTECLDFCEYVEYCEKDTSNPNNIQDLEQKVFKEFGC